LDTNVGDNSNPFKTLGKAIAVVKTLHPPTGEIVRVNLAQLTSGSYEVDDPWLFCDISSPIIINGSIYAPNNVVINNTANEAFNIYYTVDITFIGVCLVNSGTTWDDAVINLGRTDNDSINTRLSLVKVHLQKSSSP
jgi:hypothetical protein